MEIKNHSIKKWIVSISEYKKEDKSIFKVTRRIPELSVSESKVFTSKEGARKQFEEWLK